MSSPELPPERSPDRRGVETLVVGLLSAIPLVGGMISSGVEHGMAAGQERLIRQFLTELAEAQDRFLLRLSDVELNTFLARREAAAAINQATQIALKTPSREKHKLLGRAALNAASSDSEDGLVPFFWTLADKHSALEVRLLSVLGDPVNHAIASGAADYIRRSIDADRGPMLGHLLFAAIPELRFRFGWGDVDPYGSREPFQPDESRGREDLVSGHDDVGYGEDEDDEVVYDEDEDDDAPVTGPPDPGWLFHHLVTRLDDDGLLEEDSEGDTLADHLAASSDILDATLMGLDEPDDSKCYPAGTHGQTSHLGDRYLAFLMEEPAWPGEDPSVSLPSTAARRQSPGASTPRRGLLYG